MSWRNFDLDDIQSRLWTFIVNRFSSKNVDSLENELKYLDAILNSPHTVADELNCQRRKKEILKLIDNKVANNEQTLYDQFEKLYIEYKSGNDEAGSKYFQMIKNVFGEEIIFKYESVVTKKETIKSSKKNSNSAMKKFVEILDSFSCQVNIVIPDSLLVAIRKYFDSIHLPSDEEIRNMPLNRDDTRGNTSRQLIKQALSKTKNPAFYPHINAIGIKIWNWKKPNMLEYRSKILEEYTIFQNIYEEKISLGELQKVSNCNRGIRLFYHASRIMGSEFNYQKDDFLMSTTSKTIENILGIFTKIQETARCRGLIDE
jgi:hypothetical protein